MLIAIIAKILANILLLYKFVLIIRILLSWIPRALHSSNPIMRFILLVTDNPMLYLKRILPFLQIGFFDFSPIVLFIIIDYLTAWCLQVAYAYNIIS